MTSASVALATGGSLRDGLSSRLRDAAPSLARLRHDGGIHMCIRRARRAAVQSDRRGAYTTSGRAARAATAELRAGTVGEYGTNAVRGTSAAAGTVAIAAISRREDVLAVVVAEPGAHATVNSRIAAAPLATTID